MIKLGMKVKDRVTGFTGIAVAKVEYINGCVQFCVKPNVGADGKMPEGEYLDYQQLDEVKGEGIGFSTKKTGGPQRDAPKN